MACTKVTSKGNLYDNKEKVSEEQTNPVDFLLSGIYAADYVNAASLGFASEILTCRSADNKTALRKLLTEKCQKGCVSCNCRESLDTREYIDLYNALLN